MEEQYLEDGRGHGLVCRSGLEPSSTSRAWSPGVVSLIKYGSEKGVKWQGIKGAMQRDRNKCLWRGVSDGPSPILNASVSSQSSTSCFLNLFLPRKSSLQMREWQSEGRGREQRQRYSRSANLSERRTFRCGVTRLMFG